MMWLLWLLLFADASGWVAFLLARARRGEGDAIEIDESQLEGDLRHAVRDINFGAGR